MTLLAALVEKLDFEIVFIIFILLLIKKSILHGNCDLKR